SDDADSVTIISSIAAPERDSTGAREALRAVAEIRLDRQRRIFALFISGYSYDEIAEELSISARTVARQIGRARRTVRASSFATHA
ncbi:MAG: sigma factor-like helix-turn-helix DNA-binding protein, partial [Myxococcota bacterium]